MTTARAQALGDWREELEKLKAVGDLRGMKDLLIELARAHPDEGPAATE
jgi:hypothetical protein